MDPSPTVASQVVKWTVAVLAVAIGLLTAVLPSASAQPSPRARDLADRFDAQRAGDDAAATPFALGADAACLTDPTGDTADEGGPVAEPRADIVEVCAEYGDGLTIRVRPAEVTDPTTDPNWVEGLSGTGTGIDVDGDDALDYFLSYLNVDGLRAVVHDPDDPDTTILCSGTASFDGTWFVAAGIAADCLGSPGSLRFAAALLYDTNHADPEAPVAGDIAPDAALAVVDRDGAPVSGGRTTARLAGPDRFATSVAISREQFPGTVAEVYLARADAFADALSGGALTDGPVLLVPACGTLPPVVAAEIARLDPERVVALGGAAAVCDAVLAEAAAA